MMSIARVLVLFLFTITMARSEATSCSGPDLSSIAVISAGTLEVQGYDEVARSTDAGKHWVVTRKKGKGTNVSWDRLYKDSKGNVYRNSIANNRSRIQRSLDGGKTWWAVDFIASREEALVVGVQNERVYFFAGENLALDRYPVGSVKEGRLYVSKGSNRRTYLRYKAGEIEVRRFTTLKKHVLNTHLGGPPSQVTGFDIGASGELYLSTWEHIFVSTSSGETWDSIDYPAGWMHCNGSPPGR